MSKTSSSKNKESQQQTNPQNTAVEKLKYEVAQEMGIQPKTKNKKS